MLVADRLEHLAPTIVIDDAVLLTSELVTNVMVHTADDSTVHICVDGLTLLIGVEDSTPWVLPAKPTRRPHEFGVLGLELVDILASNWGCDVGVDRKTVWFQLDLR
ncbi:MAG: ATP-binding protein [Ilumatobacteraceae bacterium]